MLKDPSLFYHEFSFDDILSFKHRNSAQTTYYQEYLIQDLTAHLWIFKFFLIATAPIQPPHCLQGEGDLVII